MGMKSPSCHPSAAASGLRWGLLRSALDSEAVSAQVQGECFGAVVCFEGRVRREEDGRNIAAIAYEAYDKMALLELSKIAAETERRWPVKAALWHRIGRVAVGEASVVVACAGAHRPEAFAACEFAIDALKHRAPIWKAEFEFL